MKHCKKANACKILKRKRNPLAIEYFGKSFKTLILNIKCVAGRNFIRNTITRLASRLTVSRNEVSRNKGLPIPKREPEMRQRNLEIEGEIK